jgi:hypothetical protein
MVKTTGIQGPPLRAPRQVTPFQKTGEHGRLGLGAMTNLVAH